MKKNRSKKSKIISCTDCIIVAKTSETKKVTIASPNSKRAYTEIISVSPYRKIAKSELYADEVIINNIVRRKKTQALWERLVKRMWRTRRQNPPNNSVVAKSMI